MMVWILFAIGSAVFAGFTAVLAKIGIKNVDSNVATAVRTVVVLIFAWIMVFIVGSFDTIGDLTTVNWIFLILSGFATGASWLCYFRALQLGDVNKVTPVDKSSVILTMALAFIFFGENFSWLKLLCMALIGVGTYFMISKKTEPQTNADGAQEEADNRGKIRFTWLALALASAVFAALTSILGKIGIVGIESNLGTAIRTVVVIIMAWIMVFITGKQNTIKNIDKKSWIFIILSGFATGGSWLCFYRALQDGPASIVVPIDKLSVLITTIFAYFFLHEKLAKKALLGLIMIVAGTLLLLVKL